MAGVEAFAQYSGCHRTTSCLTFKMTGEWQGAAAYALSSAVRGICLILCTRIQVLKMPTLPANLQPAKFEAHSTPWPLFSFSNWKEQLWTLSGFEHSYKQITSDAAFQHHCSKRKKNVQPKDRYQAMSMLNYTLPIMSQSFSHPRINTSNRFPSRQRSKTLCQEYTGKNYTTSIRGHRVQMR